MITSEKTMYRLIRLSFWVMTANACLRCAFDRWLFPQSCYEDEAQMLVIEN